MRQYRFGRERLPPSTLELQANLIPIAVLSILLHMLALGLMQQLLKIDLPVNETLQLIAGFPNSDAKSVNTIFNGIENAALTIIVYFLTLMLGSTLIASLLRFVVRRSYLDLILGLPPRQSSWYYLFSGEVVAQRAAAAADNLFSSIKAADDSQAESPTDVGVTAVVTQGDETFLYWGLLHDYVAEGETLKTVTLVNAQRRKLGDDDKEPSIDPNDWRTRPLPIDDDRFYPIKGSFFILDYRDLKTLNVEYYRITWQEPEAGREKPS